MKNTVIIDKIKNFCKSRSTLKVEKDCVSSWDDDFNTDDITLCGNEPSYGTVCNTGMFNINIYITGNDYYRANSYDGDEGWDKLTKKAQKEYESEAEKLMKEYNCSCSMAKGIDLLYKFLSMFNDKDDIERDFLDELVELYDFMKNENAYDYWTNF